MPTLLTRSITIALTEADYTAIAQRSVGCTPTETARELLLDALHTNRDPSAVTLLAELLFIRRVLLNGPAQRATLDAVKRRDARLILAGQPLPAVVPERPAARAEGEWQGWPNGARPLGG